MNNLYEGWVVRAELFLNGEGRFMGVNTLDIDDHQEVAEFRFVFQEHTLRDFYEDLKRRYNS